LVRNIGLHRFHAFYAGVNFVTFREEQGAEKYIGRKRKKMLGMGLSLNIISETSRARRKHGER
jgi:hypothetical protein